MSITSLELETLADLLNRLGGVPLERIRFRPFATATVQDVLDIQRREGKLCELVEGVLVEKAVGFKESTLAAYLCGILNVFVIPRNLGLVAAPDGLVELETDLIRIPDVAFFAWDRLPGRRRPESPVPHVVPNLAIEVLSRSNTAGEMAAKRQEYFAAGVELVWELIPSLREIVVYTSLEQLTIYGAGEVLSADPVLPGFALDVENLFAELDRHG